MRTLTIILDQAHGGRQKTIFEYVAQGFLGVFLHLTVAFPATEDDHVLVKEDVHFLALFLQFVARLGRPRQKRFLREKEKIKFIRFIPLRADLRKKLSFVDFLPESLEQIEMQSIVCRLWHSQHRIDGCLKIGGAIQSRSFGVFDEFFQEHLIAHHSLDGLQEIGSKRKRKTEFLSNILRHQKIFSIIFGGDSKSQHVRRRNCRRTRRELSGIAICSCSRGNRSRSFSPRE